MLAITQYKIICLPQNIKIKIYKTVILPVVPYGCETWSLTLREEHRMRVFQNRVMRIFGPKREEDRLWRKLHYDELLSLYYSLNIVRVIKSRRMRWQDMWHVWGRGEVFAGLWLGGPKVRDHWEDLGIGGRITLRWTIGKQGLMGQTGFSWLRIGCSGRLL
jgi:hypothetical protein